MQIKKEVFFKNLKIINFKSFENSFELGPFHKFLNAIIGPNGIGKSNVFDAILFTFGNKAINLRSKRLKNLINDFKKNNSIFASSSICLRIDNKQNINDNENIKELTLTRKIFKNGNANYLINGKKINLFSIKKLFFFLKVPFEKGVFSIQQGEIELFSKMESMGKYKKKIGFLEYIEEISETSCYFDLFYKKFKQAINFKLKKIFFYRNNFENVFKKLKSLLEKKKIFLDLNFFKKKTLQKLFFGNFICCRNLINLLSKIIKIKSANFYVKVKLVLLEKMKNHTHSISCILKNFVVKNIKKKNSTLENTKKKKNWKYIYQLVNFSILKEPKKYVICLLNFITKKFFGHTWPNLYSFSNFCIEEDFNIVTCAELYKKVLKLYIYKKKIFLKKSDAVPEEFFSLCFDTAIKFGNIKNYLEINEYHSQYVLKKIGLDKHFSFLNQEFNSKKYVENSFGSFFFNSLNVQSNYLEKGVKTKVLLCDKIIKKLKHKEDRKLSIINKRYPVLKQTKKSFGFIDISHLIPVANICSFESKWSLKDHRKVFLSKITYFRNNFPHRCKIFRRGDGRFSNIYRIQKQKFKKQPSYKKLLLFFIKSNISTKIFRKFLLIKNLKRINLEKKIIGTILSTRNGEILNVSRNLMIKIKTKNKLLRLNMKKKHKNLWLSNFLCFFSKLSRQDLRKKFNVQKRVTGTIDIRTFSFKYETITLNKFFLWKKNKKRFKKDLIVTGKIFFKIFKKKIYEIYSEIDSFYSKEIHKIKIFDKEKLVLVFSIGFCLVKFLIITNCSNKNSRNYGKKKKKKLNYIFGLPTIKIIKNYGYKALDLEKILSEKKKKYGEISYNMYINNKIKLQYCWIYLSETALLKNSLLFYVSSLFIITGFSIKNHFLKEQKFKFKLECWQIIMYKRLKYFKDHTIKFLQVPIKFTSWRKFNDYENSVANNIFKTLKKIFYQVKIKRSSNNIQKIFKNYKFSYPIKKNNSNFITFQTIFLNYYKKTYFEKILGRFYEKVLTMCSNLLDCKRYHLIKNLRFQNCLKKLNKIIKQEGTCVSKSSLMEINQINQDDIYLKGLKLTLYTENKQNKYYQQMSGGEKTLSSLNLILSSQSLSPSKWFIFDEIDAALDFKNIKKISFQLKNSTKKSQIFIITLRNNMILNIYHVFGIYRVKKKTQIICLRI